MLAFPGPPLADATPEAWLAYADFLQEEGRPEADWPQALRFAEAPGPARRVEWPAGRRPVQGAGNEPGAPRERKLMRRPMLVVLTLALVPSLASFSHHGRRAAAAPPAGDKSGRTLFDPVRDKMVGGGITSVAFSPDGRRLATADISRTVKVFDALTGKMVLLILQSSAPLPEGKGLPAQSRDGPTGPVAGLAFSPDGRRLAGGGRGGSLLRPAGEVNVWDATTGKAVLTFEHAQDILSLACSPDGKRLATGTTGGTIKVWEAATGKGLLTLDHKGAALARTMSVAFDRAGKRLASGGKGTVKVWDATTGKELASLDEDNWFPSVAFSPDGRRLAAALAEVGRGRKAVKVWDVKTGKALAVFEAARRVRCLSFSPDGKRLAGACEDRSVRVWEVSTARELLTFRHGRGVTAVAFSPTGKWVAAGDDMGVVRLWKVPE